MQTVASGRGTLRLAVVGSTLSVYLDGQLLHQFIGTMIAGNGAVGVRGAGGTFETFTASPSPAPILVDEVLADLL